MSCSNSLQEEINKWKLKAIHQFAKINPFPKDPEIPEGMRKYSLGSFYTDKREVCGLTVKFKSSLVQWVLEENSLCNRTQYLFWGCSEVVSDYSSQQGNLQKRIASSFIPYSIQVQHLTLPFYNAVRAMPLSFGVVNIIQFMFSKYFKRLESMRLLACSC